MNSNSEEQIDSNDHNKLVKDGKTSSGGWMSEKIKQFDIFKLRDKAKNFFDQERATQIALGKVRGYDAEFNPAQAAIIVKKHENR